MAYEVHLETGEEVAAQIELNLSKKAQPFFFAVSNRAMYIPRIKFIAKTAPFYFQRVPLAQIRHVAVTRLRPYGLWFLATVMIAVGLVTTVWKPPLVVDKPSKQRVTETFQTIVAACMKVGISISDKRAA
jgi:hypothetical protein